MQFSRACTVALLAAARLSGSCDRSEPSPETPTYLTGGIGRVPTGDELRESSRDLLSRSCGECHTRHLDTALRGALRVFDVTQLDWSQRMTQAQLREAERRLADDIVPTRSSSGVQKLAVTADEKRLFHDYVELEIAKRIDGAFGSPQPR